MRRPFLAAALPVLAGAACSAGHSAGASPFPVGGRFRAEHVARRTTTLINGPAWATYCPSDSTLVIIALGRTWSGGLAVRTFPLVAGSRDFKVQLSLGDLGTGTAAFRAPGAGAARVGVSGAITVDVAATVSGRFEVALPDSAKQHAAVRGTLTRIPYAVLRGATCSPL